MLMLELYQNALDTLGKEEVNNMRHVYNQNDDKVFKDYMLKFFPNGSFKEKEAAFHTISLMSIYFEWEKYKQIYQFNKELFELLISETDYKTLPSYALANCLPFPSLCINNKFSCEINGVIHIVDEVYIVVFKTDKGYCLSLSFLTAPFKSSSFQIPFDPSNEKETLSDLIDRYAETEEKRKGLIENSYLLTLTSQVISVLMYLCTDEKDIVTHKSPLSQKQLKGKPTKKDMMNISTVGAKSGKIIREYNKKVIYERDTSTETGRGASKRPHIRKAHFHSFWIGKKDGERKLIVKFLSPIFVKGDNGDTEITTRKIKK